MTQTKIISPEKNTATLFAIIFWCSIIAQFYLIIVNRTASITETVIRFFSFFTILTNTLAAIYFTVRATEKKAFNRPGTLTAITVYITIVGLVYQVLLRHIWEPTGLQKVVDELLHTINPLLVILYWWLFEIKQQIKYRQVFSWLIYPLVYLVFILLRGSFSGFYPYPFINVQEIGFAQTLTNAALLLAFFFAVSCLFIFAGRLSSKKYQEIIS